MQKPRVLNLFYFRHARFIFAQYGSVVLIANRGQKRGWGMFGNVYFNEITQENLVEIRAKMTAIVLYRNICCRLNFKAINYGAVV